VITDADRSYIYDHGYVPEHLVEYVAAIAQAEPFLLDDFIMYTSGERLILVGYPLRGSFVEKELQKVLDKAVNRFKPLEVSVTAPCLPSSIRSENETLVDYYYRLDLGAVAPSQKLRNLLRRAERELEVRKASSMTNEHERLINEFIETHSLNESTRFILSKVPDYVSRSGTARIFEVRTKDEALVAFDVADFGSKAYVYYLFNFRSRERYIPGASDLLLRHIAGAAKTEGRAYVNLGLGISGGVSFFKKKWGATPFAPHIAYVYQPAARTAVQTLLERL
jgi:hypothetical protein